MQTELQSEILLQEMKEEELKEFISIHGPGVEGPLIENIQAYFLIDLSRFPRPQIENIKTNDFTVEILDKNDSLVQTENKFNEANNLHILFIPRTSEISISISFKENELKEFRLPVNPNTEKIIDKVSRNENQSVPLLEGMKNTPQKEIPFQAEKVIVRGYGVDSKKIEVGKPADFFVDFRAAYSSPESLSKDLNLMPESLSFKIKVVFQKNKKEIKSKVVSNQDGTCWVRYWPRAIGSYIIDFQFKEFIFSKTV